MAQQRNSYPFSLASGDSDPPGHRCLPTEQLSRHTFTEEEERGHYEQEKVLEAYNEWHWPFLEPLWNPRSKAQWIKIIPMLWCFIQKIPISSTLLLSAARHGEAMLLGSEALQELAMIDFLCPLPPDEWHMVKNNPESRWKDFNKRDSRWAYPSWKPLSYDKIMADIRRRRAVVTKEDPVSNELGNIEPKELRNENSRAQNCLLELFKKHLIEKEFQRQQSRSFKIHILGCNLDIELGPIPRTAAREPECPVCREHLVDHKDICESILKAASIRPEQTGSLVMELTEAEAANQAEPWILSLRADLKAACDKNPPQRSAADPLGFVEIDAICFALRLSNSYYTLKKVMEEPKCAQAVKLRCGHTIGFDCIESWILERKFTCPMCRSLLGDLRSPRFTQLMPRRLARPWIGDEAMVGPGNGGAPQEAILVDHPRDHNGARENMETERRRHFDARLGGAFYDAPLATTSPFHNDVMGESWSSISPFLNGMRRGGLYVGNQNQRRIASNANQPAVEELAAINPHIINLNNDGDSPATGEDLVIRLANESSNHYIHGLRTPTPPADPQQSNQIDDDEEDRLLEERISRLEEEERLREEQDSLNSYFEGPDNNDGNIAPRLGHPASEIPEPNPTTPPRLESPELLMNSRWERHTIPEGGEMVDDVGEEMRLHDPRNAPIERLVFPILSHSAANLDAFEERRLTPLSSQSQNAVMRETTPPSVSDLPARGEAQRTQRNTAQRWDAIERMSETRSRDDHAMTRVDWETLGRWRRQGNADTEY